MIKSLFCVLLLSLVLIDTSTSAWALPLTIKSIDLDLELRTMTKDEVEALIPLKVNDTYEKGDIGQALDELKKMGLFEYVDGQELIKGKEVILSFILIEARLVRKISVSGHMPLLAKKILRLSLLQPGDPFLEKTLIESELRIEKFFEKRGDYNTSVDIIPSHDPKHKSAVNIKIVIQKGGGYPLGNVTIAGNEFLKTDYLKKRFFSSYQYKFDKVNKKLQRIQDIYVHKGFVRARVSLQEATLNEETQKINLSINIKERKRLFVKFTGNNWFSPQTLKEYTTFYQEKGYDDFAIERSRERLIQFYNLNGFMEPKIEYTLEKDDSHVWITFSIQEGARTRLKKIIFKGNRSFDHGELIKHLESKEHTLVQQGFFQQKFINTDLARLEKFYLDHGFFDMKIIGSSLSLNEFGDLATLVVEIDEGEPYTISSLGFEGTNNFDTNTLLNKSGLKINKRYELTKIAKAIKKIETFYLEHSFAFTTITIEREINSSDHSVGLKIIVEEGRPVLFGDIILKGHYTTKDKVILGALKFKTGDPYEYKRLSTGQLNLKRLGIFDYVRVTPIGVEKEREKIDILVKLRERKSLTADVQVGFDSDKLVSGQLLITKRNIFGLAKQVQFRAIGGFELDRGEFTVYSPRVFGASWNMVDQVFVEYEDDENYNATSFGGSIGAIKHFGSDWSLLLKSEIAHFDILENQSNLDALTENLFDNTFTEFLVSAAYDTRDNNADPHDGLYTILSTELDVDLANTNNIFNITEWSISHFLSFSKRFTLINTVRASKLFRINSSAEIPVNKLFFMGGNDTVRGFDEDAINTSGGTTSIIYNAELHFRLFDSIKLAGFFDAGSLTESFSEVSSDSIRRSAGLGLRYITPVGPIRLDYGFILDKRDGEDGSRFHFSFGYFF